METALQFIGPWVILKWFYIAGFKGCTGGLKRIQAKIFVPVDVSIDSTIILSTYYYMINLKIFGRALFELWLHYYILHRLIKEKNGKQIVIFSHFTIDFDIFQKLDLMYINYFEFRNKNVFIIFPEIAQITINDKNSSF